MVPRLWPTAELSAPAETSPTSFRDLFSAQDGGLSAMESKFERHGTADDKECFKYCAYGKTGSSQRVWPNGVMDHGRADGLPLDHFVGLNEAKQARLTPACVDGGRTGGR